LIALLSLAPATQLSTTSTYNASTSPPRTIFITSSSQQQFAAMTMTDEELDREWKPNGRRPQSWVSLPPISRIESQKSQMRDRAEGSLRNRTKS
jgi:hypothetical protein